MVQYRCLIPPLRGLFKGCQQANRLAPSASRNRGFAITSREKNEREQNEMSDYSTCMREGVIKCGSDFRTRGETNILLGLPRNAGFMRGGTSIRGENAIVCWPKDEDVKNGWVNEQSDFAEDIGRGYRAFLTFSERNVDEAKNRKHISHVLDTPAERTRYVFWQEKNGNAIWYKFFGKFQLDEEATRKEGKCIFRRIASEMSCAHNLG